MANDYNGKLAAFRADTKTALARCMNKEDFYIKLLGMGLNEPRFEQLGAALDSKDYGYARRTSYDVKFRMTHFFISAMPARTSSFFLGV